MNAMHIMLLHTPGPNWRSGIHFREQPGIDAHFDYYRELQSKGKLDLRKSSFRLDTGGLIIAKSLIPEDRLENLIANDPAVQQGVLRYRIVAL